MKKIEINTYHRDNRDMNNAILLAQNPKAKAKEDPNASDSNEELPDDRDPALF